MFSKIIKSLALGFLILNLPFVYFTTSNLYKESEKPQTIVVLGASIINNSYPSGVLKVRLDKAIQIYQKEIISQIIVSGDGRSPRYNEPLVMKKYLLTNNIPESVIIMDKDGNRSIDTCWNLKNIYNVERAYISTQAFHLPRVIFLCNQSGVSSTAVYAKDSSLNVSLYGHFRELGAGWLAILEVATS